MRALAYMATYIYIYIFFSLSLSPSISRTLSLFLPPSLFSLSLSLYISRTLSFFLSPFLLSVCLSLSISLSLPSLSLSLYTLSLPLFLCLSLSLLLVCACLHVQSFCYLAQMRRQTCWAQGPLPQQCEHYSPRSWKLEHHASSCTARTLTLVKPESDASWTGRFKLFVGNGNEAGHMTFAN